MRFSVWAPRPERVRLIVDGDVHPMVETTGNWWVADITCRPDARYGFLVDDDDTPLPDPRSARQPDGVHGLSQLFSVDPDLWTDTLWTGKQLAGNIVYELHVGTFTKEGTFAAAADHLDHLVDLGVGFIEIMPVNGFNGTHNWGYDGVLWYTVHEPYGGPEGLARFVDSCHRKGVGVILDVVYNHLGPSGNYLGRFGPYVTESTNTWGQTINVGEAASDEVTSYIISNALRWFSEFHIDGLRLDAIHALGNNTAIHILEELARQSDSLSTHLRRPLTLIAESDLNDPRVITPYSGGGYGIDAQWDDDIHHAIHAAVSGERQGYYADFGSMRCLATVLTQGFYHAASYSSFRQRRHGRQLDTHCVPSTALVAYTCNHDQIGNRATGDRPSMNLSPAQLVVKAALVLLSPFTPMLFMGEEWGASTPFQFFTSHPEPELGAATAAGRVREFAEHGWAEADIPDPQDPATFTRSTLDWGEIADDPHAEILRAYRQLIDFRRQQPLVTNPWLGGIDVHYSEEDRWIYTARGPLICAFNISTTDAELPLSGTVLLSSTDSARTGPITSSHSIMLRSYSFVVLWDDSRLQSGMKSEPYALPMTCAIRS